MMASKQGNTELVSLFLQHGADIWKMNYQGFTAKMLANVTGQTTTEDILHAWERKNPLMLEQQLDSLDLEMTIERFLEANNLAHLTDLFAESFMMETVSEFKTLNQKKRNNIKKQLSPSELEVLDSSLAQMGIFMNHFLPTETNRPETPSQHKTSKGNVNDAPA